MCRLAAVLGTVLLVAVCCCLELGRRAILVPGSLSARGLLVDRAGAWRLFAAFGGDAERVVELLPLVQNRVGGDPWQPVGTHGGQGGCACRTSSMAGLAFAVELGRRFTATPAARSSASCRAGAG